MPPVQLKWGKSRPLGRDRPGFPAQPLNRATGVGYRGGMVVTLPTAGTDIELGSDLVLEPDTGGHDKFTHIVLEALVPTEGEHAGEPIAVGTTVVEGIVNGVPVKALCGKKWVPNDNPARYPICPTCIEIAKRRGWKVPAR